MKLTIKCKLLENKEQHQQLLDVMTSFNNACNWVATKALETKTFNKIALQKLVYYELRQRFNLSSQMAILIIRKVAASYSNYKQKNKVVKFSKYGAIDYDKRNFGIKSNNIISLMILGGRIKIPYQSHKLLSELKLCCQCELFYDKINKNFYINLVYDERENPVINTDNFIGVDMGIVNIATTSDGEFYSGKIVEDKRKKITSLKARLQKRGTKSAKRHLVRISKKERRYKRDVNHCISKKIVNKAKALGKGIKLENLKFAKKTVKKFKKELRDINGKLGKWAFGQLRDFITYKAKINGIQVLLVNPAYTSQKCSECGHVEESNRVTQEKFECKKCGYESNADLNASINISRASINEPNVAVVRD